MPRSDQKLGRSSPRTAGTVANAASLNRMAFWGRVGPFVALLIWCVLGMLVRAGPAATVLNNTSSGTDYFLPLNGAWALRCGLHLHTECSSPLGVLFYAPYYWSTLLLGMTDHVVRYTQAGILVSIAVVSFVVVRPPRFGWLVAACAIPFFSLYATSPCGLNGNNPFLAYEGLAYSNLCVVLGAIALLVAWFPSHQNGPLASRKDAIDGVMLGALLTWVFFIKPTHFVVVGFLATTGLVLLHFAEIKRFRIFYVSCVAGWGISCLAVTLFFEINWFDMFHDSNMASHARLNSFLHEYSPQWCVWGLASIYRRIIDAFLDSSTEILALFLVATGGLLWATVKELIKPRYAFVVIFLIVAIIVCDLAGQVLNSYGRNIPTLSFLWLLALCFFYPIGKQRLDTPQRRTHLAFCVVFCCMISLHTFELVVEHGVSCIYNVLAPQRFPCIAPNAAFKPTDVIGGGYFGDLHVLDGDADRSGFSYATRVNKALALLDKHNLRMQRIFTLDFINPFPVLLNAPYPNGQPVWVHAGHTLDDHHFLPADRIFVGTDVLLCPRQPSNADALQQLLRLYKDYLVTEFVLVDQNECWEVYKRKKQRVAGTAISDAATH